MSFVSHGLSKQPTTGGKNNMKIFGKVLARCDSLPPPPLENPGYAPGSCCAL